MEYAPEEYTKHYIVTALFKLMHAYEYEKIKVTDIAEKAGVGRATFYRLFQEQRRRHNLLFRTSHTGICIRAAHFIHVARKITLEVVSDVLGVFKANKEPFKLLKRAHLSDLTLIFSTKTFLKCLQRNIGQKSLSSVPVREDVVV